MYKQNLLELIIAQIKTKINQIAFKRMTENAYLDPEKVLAEMKANDDATLGSYASRNIFGF